MWAKAGGVPWRSGFPPNASIFPPTRGPWTTGERRPTQKERIGVSDRHAFHDDTIRTTLRVGTPRVNVSDIDVDYDPLSGPDLNGI
jgi:hypothetical protein